MSKQSLIVQIMADASRYTRGLGQAASATGRFGASARAELSRLKSFATSQHAYDVAVAAVFAMLDQMEAHLATNRYLAGEYLTEADWRAFTTLVRFDVGYHGAFKCNRRRIEDYPALRNYLRELYQWPGISETVFLDQIRTGYYQLADKHGIVGVGPELDLSTPHDRERLAGRGVWMR